jgi:winged helix DNA-binding protein
MGTLGAMSPPLPLGRDQILAFRRRVGALDERLPHSPGAFRQAAWAGLQDSMPRAAVLSLHARVEGARPESWEDPAFVQVWGPRYQTYVVPAEDIAVFTLGRLPDAAKALARAEAMAARVHAMLGGETTPYEDLGRALGVNPNAFRYAAPTGTIAIRWDGARRPTMRVVPRPEVDPLAAQLELARRYLHVFGPATAASFTKWAGISKKAAVATFAALGGELAEARTPLGDAWILAADEDGFRAEPGPSAAARLLPSGDTYFLLHGDDRALLVPDAARRPELWTPRVWPGAVLVDGEVRGVWRRAHGTVTIEPWGGLSCAAIDAVEAEAARLPIPGVEAIVVRWVT